MQGSRPGGRLLCTSTLRTTSSWRPSSWRHPSSSRPSSRLSFSWPWYDLQYWSGTPVRSPGGSAGERPRTTRVLGRFVMRSYCAHEYSDVRFCDFRYGTIECVGLLRDETNSVWRNLYAIGDEFHQTASLKLVKLKSRTLIGGTTIARPGPPASLALTRSGRPIASRLFSM